MHSSKAWALLPCATGHLYEDRIRWLQWIIQLGCHTLNLLMKNTWCNREVLEFNSHLYKSKGSVVWSQIGIFRNEPWVAELQHCCFYLINSSNECRKAQPYDFARKAQPSNQTSSATDCYCSLEWIERSRAAACHVARPWHSTTFLHGTGCTLRRLLVCHWHLRLLLLQLLPLVLSCSVNLAECSNLSLQPHPSKRLALNRTMNGTNTAFIFFHSGRLHAKGRPLSQRRFSAFLLLCLCDFVWYVEVNDPLDCSVSFSCVWVYVSFAFSQVTFPGDVGITTRNSTLLSLLFGGHQKKSAKYPKFT